MGMVSLSVEEPFQPASQPYIGHVGSSPDFIHHPQPFFGQSPMGQDQMFGQSHPQFGNPSNTSFQHVPSPYGFFPHQSSYGAGPSHMFGTHHLPIIQDLHHQCHFILR
ncbi:hypothetical protein DEO72_LG3g1409 [Vigna unguiculata]|uniref:Uncharacterized protein n=1 Tax=Vigna unguiculata TaxID=3917 RepID=A0A4D6LEH4_VIGUN|nr:hypothetical protein DEO72_LG3g1409 [Vigna unguiculata]